MNNWKIDKQQKQLLDSLFKEIKLINVKNIVDIGSGRTSLKFLADRFKNVIIEAVVYPGDERKIKPIKECVKNNNYRIIERDIKDIDFNKSYDIALAHLFLSEVAACKFTSDKFESILNLLLSIKTTYLVIVDLLGDKDLNFSMIEKSIVQSGDLLKTVYQKSSEGRDCIGYLVKKKSQ